MPRPKKSQSANFLENYGETAPAVPAIRSALWEWRDGGYKGTTETTRTLLNYWFGYDHRLPNGTPFRYHAAQRDAIESIIYCYEIAKARNLTDLYERFIPRDQASKIRLPDQDPFARYATKMATGSGKTKVMSLAVAWQYFNAVCENLPDYAKTFIVIAPNVIVFERLATDFAGGVIFNQDPVIPKSLKVFWDFQVYVRGDAERASSEGALYLTNIQQLYDGKEDKVDEPDIMTAVMGRRPPSNVNQPPSFRERFKKRKDAPILVINDEAHHTHDSDSVWNQTLRDIHLSHEKGVVAQLDFSATPRYDSGQLFAWTISDYTLKQAIQDRIVKRPMKGITGMGEVQSSIASVRYEPFLVAGVERWREYREQLAPLGKKPLLFVMMNDTKEADSIGEYLQVKYPEHFGGDKLLVIHTKKNGDITEADLDTARDAAKKVDRDDSPINAIVSVLMLREGWDVQNVTVIVGLRPYSAEANILPEQTIGRGLRLMFRSHYDSAFVERVDIIGNEKFIQFIEKLEQGEGLKLDTWTVGKEKLVINSIQPEAEKLDADIALPTLSPIYTRETSLARVIEDINVMKFNCPPLPKKKGSAEDRRFTYEGRDILTLEKLVEREYVIAVPNNAQEIISYYAQVIAQELKLVSQFSLLAPKIRDFLRLKAFGETVNLDDPVILEALNRSISLHVTRDLFLKYLQPRLIQEQTPTLEHAGRYISEITPFAWSQQVIKSAKCVLNLVPCDNEFEAEFARFLDHAQDVVRFSKLPMQFGFTVPYTDVRSNLRHYYPDFVVVDRAGNYYLVETKGREDVDVSSKDRAATLWAQRATDLTGDGWFYVKVLQAEYNTAKPTDFADCVYMGRLSSSMFDD